MWQVCFILWGIQEPKSFPKISGSCLKTHQQGSKWEREQGKRWRECTWLCYSAQPIQSITEFISFSGNEMFFLGSVFCCSRISSSDRFIRLGDCHYSKINCYLKNLGDLCSGLGKFYRSLNKISILEKTWWNIWTARKLQVSSC